GHTFLNPSVLDESIRELSTLYRAAPISGAIVYRPNSVFVSSGRFADFILVGWLLTFGYTGYLLLRHRKGRNLAFLVLSILAGAILLCASRGILMWTLGTTIIGSAAFLWGAPWKQREVIRVLRTLQRVVIGIVLSMV